MRRGAIRIGGLLGLMLAVGCGGPRSGGASGEGAASAGAELPDVRGPWAEAELPRIQVPLEGSPGRGAEQPLVTVVAFSDFECSFCRRVAPTLRRLEEAHPDTLRVHFRHLPLPMHEHAERAAQATEEARAQQGDEGFWRMHDRLFASDRLDRDALMEHARDAGLDVDRFRVALRGQVHRDRVERDLELADQIGADGTPTFFFNGRPVLGALPYDELEAVYREEEELAREAIERGIPRAALYRAAMREARLDAPRPDPEPPARGRGRRLDDRVLYAVPVRGAPFRGPADAPVTVVMFSDFVCPCCARVTPTLRALMDRHPGQIRLVFRHNPLPFHSRAMPAAQATVEAYAQGGDEAFWRMHDLLFAHQDALGTDELVAHASEAGLDAAHLRAALEEGTHQRRVEEDQQLAARFGARGTPSFFVNGRFVQGAQPLEVFEAVVADALERAEAERGRGTPPSELYEALIEGGAEQAVWTGGDEAQPRLAEHGTRVRLPVPEGAPRRGAAEPRLVIQTFSDFQCPFCGRVQPTLERLLREFPEVQLVFRHFPLPFHRDARPAAVAAIEVQRQLGDEGFWAFHDLLFDNQRSLDADALAGYARQVGADPRAVARAIEQGRHGAVVDADLAAVQRARVRIGTPAFLIGDRLLMGAQPYPVFEQAVREELERQTEAE